MEVTWRATPSQKEVIKLLLYHDEIVKIAEKDEGGHEYEYSYPNGETTINVLFRKRCVNAPAVDSSPSDPRLPTQVDVISQADELRDTKSEAPAIIEAGVSSPPTTHALPPPVIPPILGSPSNAEVGANISYSSGYAPLVEQSINNGAGVFNKIAGNQYHYYYYTAPSPSPSPRETGKKLWSNSAQSQRVPMIPGFTPPSAAREEDSLKGLRWYLN